MPRIPKVTFDSNVLEKIVDPDRCHYSDSKEEYLAIHRALKDGVIKGYLSPTYITLDGIAKEDRPEELGSTHLWNSAESVQAGAINIQIGMGCNPKPRDERSSAVHALVLDVGFNELRLRALHGPNYFGHKVIDSKYYDADFSEGGLRTLLDRVNSVDLEIQKLGCGRSVAVNLGMALCQNAGLENALWYKGLDLASNAGDVAQAVAEWADGDSIAAHIGHGNDFFCTCDKARGTKVNSVFNEENRNWLSCKYGVRLVDPSGLLQELGL